ncbi:methyltransferase domain-containing protein [Geminicoccaceae bacterium 1502E]|nr:methyltransferase domain-containing protein [Geminicoccaceae bacterium 1502E]
MDAERSPDLWSSGERYEAYVGRWSRMVAAEFLSWLAAPPGLAWLDVGCGTGALSGAVARSCAPGRLAGIDPSAGFLALAREQVPTAELHEGDAQALPFPDASFDRAVSGLVLNFVPDPARAVAEMARVLRPGGEAALYVWDYAGRMELMRRFWDAAAALDPAASALDEGRRSPICHPGRLRELLEEKGGLREVETRAIDVPTVFRDFDDYWSPFLGGQGPAPAYCVRLDGKAREQLRERLRASLPAAPDGSIRLLARTWAVRGRKV